MHATSRLLNDSDLHFDHMQTLFQDQHPLSVCGQHWIPFDEFKPIEAPSRHPVLDLPQSPSGDTRHSTARDGR